LRTLYEQAISFENCVGISIGTRSDCVDDEKLTLLEELAARTSVTLEYGLQSPHLKSLLWMRRGHDYDSFVRAVEETARRRILTGAHIILGIPGETREMMRETAVLISGLPIRFLKIHQLQVIRGTPLSNLYEKNPFPLWDLDEYADFICEFIEELRQDMVIQRLYSTSRPDLLIGPVWGGIRRDVDRILHERIRSRHVIQGRRRKEAIR
jgi:radical SAM protein (TIGR01212 family)